MAGTQRTRAYFTANGVGPYDGFSTQNIPTQQMYEDLFASVAFKEEVTDRATTTAQGLVRLATLSEVLNLTEITGENIRPVVAPHQLPTVEAGTAMLLEDRSGGETKHKIYKLSFDPDSLEEVVSETTIYAVVVADGVAKKLNIDDIGGSSLWELDGSTLVPIGGEAAVSVCAESYYLPAQAGGVISPLNWTDHAGAELIVKGGSAYSAGGSSYNGGNIYLFGGLASGAGTNGKTILAYDGSAARGKVGVFSDNNSAFDMYVDGSLKVTGAISIVSDPGVGNPDRALFVDSSGNVGFLTEKAFMDFMVGSTMTDQCLFYFDGTNVRKIDTGNTEGHFLSLNAQGDLQFAHVPARDVLLQMDTDVFAASDVTTLVNIRAVLAAIESESWTADIVGDIKSLATVLAYMVSNSITTTDIDNVIALRTP